MILSTTLLTTFKEDICSFNHFKNFIYIPICRALISNNNVRQSLAQKNSVFKLRELAFRLLLYRNNSKISRYYINKNKQE